MADDEKAAKVFAEFTVCEVMNRIIKGEELPGFLPIADACGLLLDEIQEKIASNRSVLYVSHDAIIRLVPVDNSLIFINFMNRLRAKRTDSLTNRFFLLSIWPV